MTDPAPPWRVLDAGDPPPIPAPPAGVQAAAHATSGAAMVRPLALLALAGLLAAGAFVLAIGGGDGSGVLVEASGTSPEAMGSGSPVATDGVEIVVEVAGAVRRPGMFRVAPGARVGDLIALAGGYGPRVDVARVDAELNLAAVVADGERVRVPSRDDVRAPSTPSVAPLDGSGAGLIDLNRATLEQLDTLPGVGPVTAEKIIAAREEAAFAAVEELRSRGILGEKTFERVRPLVTVP